MIRYIKNKLKSSDEVAETDQFYSPLRIALHSTIEMNTVDWLVMQQSLHSALVLPTSPYSVLAIGEISQDKDTLYRFYLEDAVGEEYMLQLCCGEDRFGKPSIKDRVLFRQVVSIIPTTQASFDAQMAQLGFDTLQIDSIEYNRVWGDKFTEKMDFIPFNEKLIQPTGVSTCENFYLLYDRKVDNPIGDPATEMVLVGVEIDDDSDSIVMLVGLEIPEQSIQVQ